VGILNRVRRVDLGGGDWIDLQPLTSDELEALQKEALEAVESGDANAASFAMLAAIRKRIVAWSEDLPVTAKNTAKLPHEVNTLLVQALTGQEEIPLALGSPSTATSTE
jgi:hypothetical protein